MQRIFIQKQARKPRSYASPKLRLTDSLTDLLTGVKCRATSVAKKSRSGNGSCVYVSFRRQYKAGLLPLNSRTGMSAVNPKEGEKLNPNVKGRGVKQAVNFDLFLQIQKQEQIQIQIQIQIQGEKLNPNWNGRGGKAGSKL